MLKALELVGFKSFADKTRFEFPQGITVVVGPNGSGKSNIVDAIKWVLGEQSVKSLRGREMADVIFNGSGSRRAMNSAEITLTFDNANRLLPVDAARGPHHPPRLPQRRGRIPAQPQPLPAARHPRPALRHGHGHASLQRHRAGQGRRAAAIVAPRPPRDLRGGGRHQPLQD